MTDKPKFTVGETYIRMRDSQRVYPVHDELAKQVSKDLAEFVVWNGKTFEKTSGPEIKKSEPVRIKSSTVDARIKAPTVPSVETPAVVVAKPSVDLSLGMSDTPDPTN